MKRKGIFVTGTDTGVGKTVVAATIARVLKMRGCNVGVMKPVTTGCETEGGEVISADAKLLAFASYKTFSDEIAPYRFKEAAAPSDAAKAEGKEIDCSEIVKIYNKIEEEHDFVIVEGAGGLMVPLVGGILMADLVNMLNLPLLVVARAGIGTINHTVLTTFCAKQLGLETRGIIINNFPQHPDFAEKRASHSIGSIAGAPILGIWKHIESIDDEELIEGLADWLDGQPETDIILREILN